VTEDLLEALLRTALAEKSLDEKTLPHFAAALRARAEQILAERVKPLEERAAALEKEATWRAEVVAGLEKEKVGLLEQKAGLEKESAWRETLVAGLEEEKAGLLADKEHWTAEGERRQRQIDDLKREREALIAEKRASEEAHERLLEHHRGTLLRLAQALEPLPAELPWSYRRVRARIAELLEALRKEAP
jgi:hypothetical protein